MDYDIVIAGAGVVGLACARELAASGFSTLVLERHGSFGRETSSRNSEVIHAGIYYPTGSLKARLCVPGNQSLVDWCDRYLVPYRRTGKFIIATNHAEEEKLNDIYERAVQNGVPQISYIHIDKFREKEPNVKAVAAVWSPVTGIVDTHRLMMSLKNAGEYHGCDYAFKHTVKRIEKLSGGYEIFVSGPDNEDFSVKTGMFVNTAGLDADKVAESAGFDIIELGYEQTYCRGHYFRIKSSKKGLVSHLIYPVPPETDTSLGIHVTIDMNDELKLGPDVQYLKDRVQDYSIPDGLEKKFYKSVTRYLRGLDPDDIMPDQAGIRPKLQKEGEPVKDFIIKEESDNGYPGFVNLIGIESPGLTCCLEIGAHVRSLLK